MIFRTYLLLQSVFIFCLMGLNMSACPIGWFGGNCEYKCHCTTTNTCNFDGECPDGKCDIGWFGPACQYQDLFSLPQVSMSSLTDTNLTDRDDATCITTTSTVLTVTLDTTYPMTWIRLVGSSIDKLKRITLTFNETNNIVTQCRKTIIQDRTLDIICHGDVLVKNLSFTGDGVSSLCSLYISGDRNVAMNQITSQSSNYNDSSRSYPANLAVDGNADSNFTHSSCTHTRRETASNWNVTFSRPHLVNRYVIYNRNTNKERLLNFSLSSLNPDQDVVFTYSIPPVLQLIYAVTSSTELVSSVAISTNVSQILTLCEVEIYGDSACGQGTFGLDCSKTCNCLNQSESCFVATGGCSSGCRSGYYKDCLKECANLTWGFNCQNNCSTNCFNGSCNNTNGLCTFGCLPGYMGDNCSIVCPEFKWGPNCLGNCSKNCANKTCGNHDGKCDYGCVAGYIGDSCTKSSASALDDETEYHKGLASGIGIGIGVMIATDIVICIFIYVWLRRRQKQTTKPRDTTDRQYDHVGAIQQNEHQYDSLDKKENVYDITKRYYNM